METLTNSGLNAKLFGSRHDENVPRYSVISQDPAPGTIIKKGRDVIIYISKGPKENVMPDLRQMTLKEARLVIEKEEFITGVVSDVYHFSTPAGSIVAQYPKPFSSTLKGSAINLLVSRGQEPQAFVMPDLSNMSLENAASILKRHNLSVSKITSGVQQGVQKGHIIKHEPQFGSKVTAVSSIKFLVNSNQAERIMDPEKLEGVIGVSHQLGPGFLKKHVRVEADLFGTTLTLYDNYAKPNEDILVLIPSGIKTKVNFFIDNQLIKTKFIDPWQTDNNTGEITWE